MPLASCGRGTQHMSYICRSAVAAYFVNMESMMVEASDARLR